ncbi:2-oxoglutarate and iron-dependent oxygenase domain-containing protein [Streptomyces sp. NPDC002838]|uniref:isopenicillin N synthase family dioxygenase n=1 Tax=Streptomyces sp. NPDC002838 TaxID=3154436 RepID=UPI0033253D28
MAQLTLPVIDLSGAGTDDHAARVESEIRAAFENVGVAYLVGHDVPPDMIDGMLVNTRAFFHQPLPTKLRAAADPPSRYRGYCSAEDSVPAGVTPPELWESFEFNRFDAPEEAVAAGCSERAATLLKPNLWPDEPLRFHDITRGYFGAVERLMYQFLGHCARALGLESDWFVSRFTPHCSYLSLNYYPPQLTPPQATQLRQVPHTDIAGPTFLYQDGSEGGLEIQAPDGTWAPVPHRPGAFVVFMSDLMARWTNDRWKSTLHRVVNPPSTAAGTDRVSLAYFSYPNLDTLVDVVPTCRDAVGGTGYEPVVAVDWVLKRMGRPG